MITKIIEDFFRKITNVAYICDTFKLLVMRTLKLICWFILWPAFSFAGNPPLESLLKELDEVVANKHSYDTAKEVEIDKLKERLHATSDAREQYNLYQDLFDTYLHYQADSALICVERKKELFPLLPETFRKEELLINYAEVMGVMGMYNEAADLLKQVNPKELDEALLGYYYRTMRAYYGWLADYTAYPLLKQEYQIKTQQYRDSITLTNVPDRYIVEAEKYIIDGKAEKAIEMLNELLCRNPEQRQQAFIHYTFSEAYKDRGETDKQICELAQTALLDLKSATKEYASLQKLAYLLYDNGDVDRAYKYLNCSMEDAVFCNARLRFIEVAQFFPIIDKAYKLKTERSKVVALVMLISVSLLSLFLIVAVFYLYRWMKKLSLMREHLKTANHQLHLTNEALEQTGKIKEVYIARYLERCISYLDKLEQYRRTLAKMAMASRIDDLFKTIKSDDFIRDERKVFYNEFDKSFLDLFPHFITSFNELLQEEHRIVPKPGELLTTELRIFALIRLGVTDSNQIAHFLSYSLATIYNYRSKIRNRAKGDKDKFEEEVMKL